MTARAGKGPIRTLAASSSEVIVRLDFKNHTQSALESRHETRAAARLGAQTAAGSLRKYVLLYLSRSYEVLYYHLFWKTPEGLCYRTQKS